MQRVRKTGLAADDHAADIELCPLREQVEPGHRGHHALESHRVDPSGKVGSEMNAAVSFGMPRYCSMAPSTAARLVSAISCPWDSALVNASRVLGYFLAHAAVTA